MTAKFAIALGCLFFIAFVFQSSEGLPQPNDPLELQSAKLFGHFIQKYQKRYSSKDEFATRYANFKASLKRAAEKNAKSKGAVYGVTKFSDMTPEEFKSSVLMSNPITKEEEKKAGVEMLQPKNVDLPKSFDWRPLGAVTPVKNQEQCGSCWAFSATENIESMWILAKKATNSTLNLAPQQIVDCSDWDLGCNGGEPGRAFDYVIGAGGMEAESSYPYTAEDGTCRFDSKKVVASISSWKYATSYYNENTLQQNLVSWGPLSVCVDAESWQDYVSGVMTWEECAWVNLLDHCVQLVGYNAEDSNSPYWMVRNSWGTDWGIEGYIHLQMWKDTCGIAHEASSVVV